jgi:hypothetical protein
MRGENNPLATVYSRLIHDTRSARIAVFPINVSKPRTESVTIGNQDLPGRLAQAAIRNHIRVLLGVNIDSINDPRALDINFWKQWSPQVPGVQPGSIKVEAIYTGSPFVLFSISIEMWAMLSNDPAYTYVSHITSTNLLAAPPPIDLLIRPPRDTMENRPRS